MEASRAKRPIGWLVDKAMFAIMESVVPTVGFLVQQLKMTPNNIYEYYEGDTSTEFAQSARWLAIIYRDYGPEVFREVFNLVKILNEAKPQEVES